MQKTECGVLRGLVGWEMWMVDLVRVTLLAAVPATLSDGRKVIFVEPTFGGPTLIRDDDISPPVWYVPDRFSFRSAS